MGSARIVRIGGSGDALLRALSEHRPATGEWEVRPLDGPVEGDALVILDFTDDAERRTATQSIRAGGFGGRILTLGGEDAGRGEEAVRRPVRLGALLTRIEAHCADADDSAIITLGPYAFLAQDSMLRAADADAIRLTELECRLLTFLAEAQGGLVSRERLLEGVWGYSAELDTHTVETHIWRLRQKIETDDPATRFLVTETGGYRLLSGGLPETG
jgi:hypothetical protein